MKTTTTGIGMLISKLVEYGCTEIFLFLGGSSTNDGGAGMAAQLGFQFLDKNDKLIIPKGEDLIKIAKIITTTDTESLKKIRFTALTDVSHPMHGQNGAAYCFARQKGANPEEIIELDKGLLHLDNLFKRDLNKDISLTKGAGAAGALGAGCLAFLNAEIKSGLKFIIETTKLENEIINSDIIITGEGRIDDQSIKGKVVSGIADLCKKHNKKLILVCGESTISAENLSKLYHSSLHSISEKGMSKEQAIKEARVRLKKNGKEIMISEVNRAR
jgi:glycerate kinase